MTKEESILRGIIQNGKSGKRDIRILIFAVERARELMFGEGIPMEEIKITKSIYPEAGKRFGKSSQAATRQIERLAILCWEEMGREQRREYIGEETGFPSPRELILYLAYYCEFHESYRETLRRNRETYFQKKP